MSHYTILEPLGRGGVGVVCRARDNVLGRDVAVKFLTEDPDQVDPSALGRFQREAQAYLALSHPHIVKILDVGEMEGKPFIVMELVEAEDLNTRLKKEGAFGVDEILAVLDQVLDALAYCHSHGCVHRDVKPSNIMVDGSGRAILMDFGYAKAAEQSGLTRAGALVGTPRYIAPEALVHGRYDPQSDLWSLGVTAWELLTGRKLFHGRNVKELFQQIAQRPVPAVQSIRDVTSDVSELVARLVQRDVTRRLESADAARQEVQRIQAKRLSTGLTRPVVVRPRPGKPRRSRRRARRWMAAIVGVLAGIGLLALAATRWVTRPAAAPASPPPRAIVRYEAFDRLVAEFDTPGPECWWVKAPSGEGAWDRTWTTHHRLELAIDPVSPPSTVNLGREGQAAASAMLPLPPSPLDSVRKLVDAVRSSGLSDRTAFSAYREVRNRLAKVGMSSGSPAVAAHLKAHPELARSVLELLDRFRSGAGVEERWRVAWPYVGPVLASSRVGATERWGLVDALDRLEAHDALSVQVGRERYFRALDRARPVIECTVTPLPAAKTPDRAAALALPPPADLAEGEESLPDVIPRKGRAAYYLYTPEEAPPADLDRFRPLTDRFGETVEDSAYGASLTFTGSRARRVEGVALALLVASFHPQVALRVHPPGAPGAVPIRRPLESYDSMSSWAWCCLRLRGTFAPQPGTWTIDASSTYSEDLRPYARIDRLIVR